jgi:hypothetical protein
VGYVNFTGNLAGQPFDGRMRINWAKSRHQRPEEGTAWHAVTVTVEVSADGKIERYTDDLAGHLQSTVAIEGRDDFELSYERVNNSVLKFTSQPMTNSILDVALGMMKVGNVEDIPDNAELERVMFYEGYEIGDNDLTINLSPMDENDPLQKASVIITGRLITRRRNRKEEHGEYTYGYEIEQTFKLSSPVWPNVKGEVTLYTEDEDSDYEEGDYEDNNDAEIWDAISAMVDKAGYELERV